MSVKNLSSEVSQRPDSSVAAGWKTKRGGPVDFDNRGDSDSHYRNIKYGVHAAVASSWTVKASVCGDTFYVYICCVDMYYHLYDVQHVKSLNVSGSSPSQLRQRLIVP